MRVLTRSMFFPFREVYIRWDKKAITTAKLPMMPALEPDKNSANITRKTENPNINNFHFSLVVCKYCSMNGKPVHKQAA